MATYGRSFTLLNSGSNGVGAAARGPGNAGTYTREAGFLSYYEICEFRRQGGATTVYDTTQQAVYTYVGDQWVGYDNEQSLSAKLNYMRQGNFGGWMSWNLDLDDFQGAFCSAGSYPLHRHLNQAMTKTAALHHPALPSFCANKPDGLHANPGSCESYYNCLSGNDGISPCGKGTVFNPVSQMCDSPLKLTAQRKMRCGV